MSSIQAALEHRRLKADLEAALSYGDGGWMRQALEALTRFLEERYRQT
jgi:hypothetical protein